MWIEKLIKSWNSFSSNKDKKCNKRIELCVKVAIRKGAQIKTVFKFTVVFQNRYLIPPIKTFHDNWKEKRESRQKEIKSEIETGFSRFNKEISCLHLQSATEENPQHSNFYLQPKSKVDRHIENSWKQLK